MARRTPEAFYFSSYVKVKKPSSTQNIPSRLRMLSVKYMQAEPESEYQINL